MLLVRRILLADDNSDVLENLAELLHLEGHQVYTVADGSQAVEEACRQS